MEAHNNKTVSLRQGLILLKVLFTFLSFLFSLYLIFPGMVLAKDVDNILLPDGKSPNPKLLSTPNGEYISFDELQKVYLPHFTKINSNELSDKASRSLIIIPGAMYIVANINTEQFIVQLSKPIYSTLNNSKSPESYIAKADIITILTATNIYEIKELNQHLVLRNKTIISNQELPEFTIGSTHPSVEISEALTDEPNETYSDNTEEITTEQSDSYKPSGIVNNSVFSKYQNSTHLESSSEAISYSIVPTAISVINSTRKAFLALKPNSNKVIYLEPEILTPRSPKGENAITPKEEESLPPNVFIVPKGLFRRGIDGR